mgnify:CR=1 FL=1
MADGKIELCEAEEGRRSQIIKRFIYPNEEFENYAERDRNALEIIVRKWT